MLVERDMKSTNALMIQSLPAALQNNLAVTSKLSILKQEATLWAEGDGLCVTASLLPTDFRKSKPNKKPITSVESLPC